MNPKNLIFFILSLPLMFIGFFVATDPARNIVIEKSAVTINPEGSFIVGNLRNMKSDKTYSSVSIKAVVVDEEGRKETLISVGDLQPDESVYFQSERFREIADYRLTVHSPDNRRSGWLRACASTFCR